YPPSASCLTCCNKSPTPAAAGEEKEVPALEEYCVSLFPLAEITVEPIAVTSGLIRPSSVGPKLVNQVATTSEGSSYRLSPPIGLMAPTKMMFLDTEPAKERQSYPPWVVQS